VRGGCLRGPDLSSVSGEARNEPPLREELTTRRTEARQSVRRDRNSRRVRSEFLTAGVASEAGGGGQRGWRGGAGGGGGGFFCGKTLIGLKREKRVLLLIHVWNVRPVSGMKTVISVRVGKVNSNYNICFQLIILISFVQELLAN